jgi:hypothetical protein
MAKKLMTLIGILVFIIVPDLTIAQSNNGGHGNSQGKTNSPTPAPAAYEHADENARFLRDSQDAGKNQGQVTPKVGGEPQNKDKDDDQETAKDKGKINKKSKSKGKSSDSADKKKDKTLAEKDKEPADKSEDVEVKY